MTEEQRITLEQLQQANLIVSMANRERPSGYRCALAERNGNFEMSAAMIKRAMRDLSLVMRIPHDGWRNAVLLASRMHDGEAAYSRTEIARSLGVHVRTLQHYLAAGLDCVSREMRFVPLRNKLRASLSPRFRRVQGIDVLPDTV